MCIQSHLGEFRLPVWFGAFVSVAPGYLKVPATEETETEDRGCWPLTAGSDSNVVVKFCYVCKAVSSGNQSSLSALFQYGSVSTCFTHRVRISSICSMPSHHILGWYSKLALTS